MSNNIEVTATIPEEMKSISNTKHFKMEPNTEGSSTLGIQWTVTDDNHQDGALVTQRKKLSLASSVFDIVGFSALSTVHMSRMTSEKHLD